VSTVLQSSQGDTSASAAAARLAEARGHDQAGRLAEAAVAYQAAIEAAATGADIRIRIEALRRLSIVHHHRNESEISGALVTRSLDLALECGQPTMAAEALNTMASFAFEKGAMTEARATYDRALALGGEVPALRARIEQNLGILANIQGDLVGALAHYAASLDACLRADDRHGCAIAYHNLGMISADQGHWAEADRYFGESHSLAVEVGEVHLQGLCLLNHAEVHLARQAYEPARDSAERALTVFNQLDARLDKADAYRVLGMVYRETGRTVLAESRLKAAIEMARASASVLSEAEASRELGRLYQEMGRNQEALTLLNAAHRLFGRLDARVDLVDVGAKAAELERTYLAVVRDWGQSLESADGYTHGHCERVAGYALAVASALALSDEEQTTIRLGAYLHDLGKVRVPHEILNKPGALTAEEFAVMKLHPVWGIEMLAAIEFPWDIKPIIRWHHEKYDGTGYPDRLQGDEIPLSAQIICIVDVYDALTTTRSYRPAMDHAEAMRRMHDSRHWWRPSVFAAFERTVGARAASS
jgi:putative nucleotidyltransferase with HDIG domain